MVNAFMHPMGRALVTLSVASGLVASGLPWSDRALAESLPAATHEQSSQAIAYGAPPLADGVYLYGEVSRPEQIGAAYVVFQVSGQVVTGAFYMPQSSFDCFHGEVQPSQLSLTVIDSYDRTAHPYALALEQAARVASSGSVVSIPVTLTGYTPIDQVSDADQRILSVCQANLQP